MSRKNGGVGERLWLKPRSRSVENQHLRTRSARDVHCPNRPLASRSTRPPHTLSANASSGLNAGGICSVQIQFLCVTSERSEVSPTAFTTDVNDGHKQSPPGEQLQIHRRSFCLPVRDCMQNYSVIDEKYIFSQEHGISQWVSTLFFLFPQDRPTSFSITWFTGTLHRLKSAWIHNLLDSLQREWRFCWHVSPPVGPSKCWNMLHVAVCTRVNTWLWEFQVQPSRSWDLTTWRLLGVNPQRQQVWWTEEWFPFS